ncbi:hypothetical protein [Microbacterium dextranolyticum]|uniref:Uncharacterized protein n=1 Tax=Microbacterium dextranolyticum TaxID=36806 RepID=A0A9W6HNW1_9MICO|nr:hypothetical protein [Microbacterium dextranolyticum]MBM7464033.1 hypothetical protein [Microbacterium dextranolyticum]GLJ96637.1 hypothetical protein GCM10017591_27000 [Microbacterium dextranolyticum]
MPDNALSLQLDGTPEPPAAFLQVLYRLTGRSTVEMRRSILAGEPFYTVPLFGPEHITVVPRLEKTIDYLTEQRVPFRLVEWIDGERDEISLDTLREILEVTNGPLA